MKNVIVLDDDELIVKDYLLSELLFHAYRNARAEIEQTSGEDAAVCILDRYIRTEEEVRAVFTAYGREHHGYAEELRQQLESKFSVKDSINDGTLPF